MSDMMSHSEVSTPHLFATVSRVLVRVMILPDDEECKQVIAALADEPNLTAWEQEFVESNLDREHFSPAQRESIANLREKYDT